MTKGTELMMFIIKNTTFQTTVSRLTLKS